MHYPNVTLTSLDVPQAEALQRIADIAAGLGWETTDTNDMGSFFDLPTGVAGSSGVELHVWMPPEISTLVCELKVKHDVSEDHYRAVLTAAAQALHARYRADFNHNLSPYLEMFPEA